MNTSTATTTALDERIDHALQTPVRRLLIPVPTDVRIRAARRWVKGHGDPVGWVRSNANRYGDVVLLDLRGHPLCVSQVREISRWAQEARGRGVTTLIIGREWHRSPLRRLISHETPGDSDIVWCT